MTKHFIEYLLTAAMAVMTAQSCVSKIDPIFDESSANRLKIQRVELEVALESEAGSLSAGGLRISEVVHHFVVGVQCQHAACALVDGIGACRGFPLLDVMG